MLMLGLQNNYRKHNNVTYKNKTTRHSFACYLAMDTAQNVFANVKL